MKGLTPKVRKLLKGKAAGKTQKEAARAAGLNEQYASDVLKKPEVKTALEKLMDKVGLSDAKVFKAHADLIQANKTVSIIPVKPKPGEQGETEGRDASANSVEFVDVPDWQARAKGIDMAHKIKGRYVEKHEVSGVSGGPVMFRIVFESPKEK